VGFEEEIPEREQIPIDYSGFHDQILSVLTKNSVHNTEEQAL